MTTIILLRYVLKNSAYFVTQYSFGYSTLKSFTICALFTNTKMAVLRSCAVFLAFLFITDARGDAYTSGLSNRIVVTSRVGCEIVTSRPPCPATLLNSDLAVEYETDAEMVNITIDDLRAEYSLGDDCAQTLTKIYCSKITPRCYENGTKYFENVTESCSKVDRICPKDSVEEGLCKDLKIGWQPLDACVMPTARINGSCPQPKSKVMAFFPPLENYLHLQD